MTLQFNLSSHPSSNDCVVPQKITNSTFSGADTDKLPLISSLKFASGVLMQVQHLKHDKRCKMLKSWKPSIHDSVLLEKYLILKLALGKY